MVDNIDSQIAKAQERIKKLQQRKANVAAEAELQRRKAEITLGIQKGVKEALGTLKLDVPPEGITVFIHKEGDSGLGVDVKLGKGSRNGSNGSRKTISDLGISEYVLPDGSKVGSASAVLDHFKHPHKNDSAARLILGWAKDHPTEAETVKVIIGKEKVSLKEAATRI
jgi:hypothetical protein